MQIRDKAFYAGERGFTLIELLVVISIISLLSSIVLTSVNSARAKARDARKQADFRAISTALQLYFDSTGRMPLNYSPGSGVCEGNSSFERSMQELVSAGFLPVIPRSPTSNSLYCYYDYGSGNNIGALMTVYLETIPDTTTGISPSCRPWGPGINWCDQSSNKFYCICNTY